MEKEKRKIGQTMQSKPLASYCPLNMDHSQRHNYGTMPVDSNCWSHTVHPDNKLTLHELKKVVEGWLYCPHLQGHWYPAARTKALLPLNQKHRNGALTLSLQCFAQTLPSILHPCWLLQPLADWRNRQRKEIQCTAQHTTTTKLIYTNIQSNKPTCSQPTLQSVI